MKKLVAAIIIMTLLFSCSKKSIHLFEPENQKLNYPIIAHSHNDYDQDIPIFKALDYGFTSLEVDIAFDGKDLRVSHDEDDLSDKPKFEDSYLIPIIEQTSSCSDRIILLVDIKNYSSELLNNLNSILSKYEDCFASRNKPTQTLGRIKVILSGDIPRQEIIDDESNEFLFIDGRLTDFDLDSSSEIVPLISMDFSDLTKWDGKGNPDEITVEILRNTIELVHSKGKIIRFWKTQDRESTWLTLIALNVDVIGVDHIEHFYKIMKENGLIK